MQKVDEFIFFEDSHHDILEEINVGNDEFAEAVELLKKAGYKEKACGLYIIPHPKGANIPEAEAEAMDLLFNEYDFGFIPMKLYDIGLAFATRKHEGQFRDPVNGVRLPYISHSVAVAEIVEAKLLEIFQYKEELPDDVKAKILRYIDIGKFIAVNHDVGEDTDTAIKDTVAEIEAYSSEEERAIISKALYLLDKRNHKNYLDGMLAIREDVLARISKISDIEHNFSTTPKGSRKDKYRMAYYILSGKLLD